MDVYEALINIGIKLSSEQNLDRLLDSILQNARYICDADAGTLYLKDGNRLRFAISQNASLEMEIGREAFKKLLSPHTFLLISFPQLLLVSQYLIYSMPNTLLPKKAIALKSLSSKPNFP